MGFAVVHAFDPKVLEAEIKAFNPDLALEWQHGVDDFPIRDILRKCGKEVPIFLSLNWNGKIPSDFLNLGYRDYLPVPWEFDELFGKFYEALPESKRPMLMALWKRAGKRR